jgi:hypothetical protein
VAQIQAQEMALDLQRSTSRTDGTKLPLSRSWLALDSLTAESDLTKRLQKRRSIQLRVGPLHALNSKP